jgi:Spy/CpxP family protein refolding chaperone
MLLMLLAGGAAWAQGSDGSSSSSDPDRFLERYRERLALSSEQADKIRGILEKARQKSEEQRQETEAKVREALTETQRTKLEELRKGSGGGSGDGGRGGSFFAGRWLGPSLDDLQRELDLTPDQREKIGGILQSAMDTVRQRIEEARASGFQGFDWQTVRAEYEKMSTETSEKVKAALTPAQQEKYTKQLEERRKAVQGFFRRSGGEERAAPEDRVARAMDALKIADPDEAEAVRALVARVVKLQADLADHERAARDKARDLLKTDGIGDDAVQQRLAELRKARQAIADPLDRAQEELGQVVTVRQEAELVQQGILK